MKQFEKQWKKNQPVWDMGEDTIGHYRKAKEYWREALEWVLSNGTRSKVVNGVFLSVLDMIKIEEELEE